MSDETEAERLERERLAQLKRDIMADQEGKGSPPEWMLGPARKEGQA